MRGHYYARRGLAISCFGRQERTTGRARDVSACPVIPVLVPARCCGDWPFLFCRDILPKRVKELIGRAFFEQDRNHREAAGGGVKQVGDQIEFLGSDFFFGGGMVKVKLFEGVGLVANRPCAPGGVVELRGVAVVNDVAQVLMISVGVAPLGVEAKGKPGAGSEQERSGGSGEDREIQR